MLDDDASMQRQVVRPDKVVADFPHPPDRAPAATLVCLGFKDGSEVRSWSTAKSEIASVVGGTLNTYERTARLRLEAGDAGDVATHRLEVKIRTRNYIPSFAPETQDMLATWSDPFVERFHDTDSASLAELSVVESRVRLKHNNASTQVLFEKSLHSACASNLAVPGPYVHMMKNLPSETVSRACCGCGDAHSRAADTPRVRPCSQHCSRLAAAARLCPPNSDVPCPRCLRGPGLPEAGRAAS